MPLFTIPPQKAGLPDGNTNKDLISLSLVIIISHYPPVQCCCCKSNFQGVLISLSTPAITFTSFHTEEVLSPHWKWAHSVKWKAPPVLPCMKQQGWISNKCHDQDMIRGLCRGLLQYGCHSNTFKPFPLSPLAANKTNGCLYHFIILQSTQSGI